MLIKFGYDAFIPNTINRFLNYSKTRWGNQIQLGKFGIGGKQFFKK